MDAINLADAKAHLSKLVDRVEAGGSIDIASRRCALQRGDDTVCSSLAGGAGSGAASNQRLDHRRDVLRHGDQATNRADQSGATRGGARHIQQAGRRKLRRAARDGRAVQSGGEVCRSAHLGTSRRRCIAPCHRV